MRIANVEIGPGALLAPMEAVTDLPFRTVCEELGASLTFTEFLSAEALTRGAEKATSRMWPSFAGRPFVVQIFGREPEVLARAAVMASEVGATVVDINMGCPAKKVTAGLCGSALMREPELAVRLVEAIRRSVPAHIPVTVKHRIGWDDRSINAVEFARRLVDAGAAMITVHGRTRAQGFSGEARLEPIASVRDALPREIPVVGNGDVTSLAGYRRMRAVTGCDAVMIGRAARGNPWLFQQIRALESGEPLPAEPTVVDRWRTWRRHAELVREHAPAGKRIHELRKTLAWYSRGMRGGSILRQRAFAEGEVPALLAVGDGFFGRLADDQVTTAEPAGPVAKSIARQERRNGNRVEADDLPTPSYVA